MADKVSSLLLYVPELMLHVSRPVRWDSDHVTIMNDMTLDFFKELVRADGLNRAHVGLDYFDASINRIGAYIIGTRATQKCILSALLEPLACLAGRSQDAALRRRVRLFQLQEWRARGRGIHPGHRAVRKRRYFEALTDSSSGTSRRKILYPRPAMSKLISGLMILKKQ